VDGQNIVQKMKIVREMQIQLQNVVVDLQVSQDKVFAMDLKLKLVTN
jgi:hypothetical protein